MFFIYLSYKNAIEMKSFKFTENELTLHDMILVVTEFMNTIDKQSRSPKYKKEELMMPENTEVQE